MRFLRRWRFNRRINRRIDQILNDIGIPRIGVVFTENVEIVERIYGVDEMEKFSKYLVENWGKPR